MCPIQSHSIINKPHNLTFWLVKQRTPIACSISSTHSLPFLILILNIFPISILHQLPWRPCLDHPPPPPPSPHPPPDSVAPSARHPPNSPSLALAFPSKPPAPCSPTTTIPVPKATSFPSPHPSSFTKLPLPTVNPRQSFLIRKFVKI